MTCKPPDCWFIAANICDDLESENYPLCELAPIEQTASFEPAWEFPVCLVTNESSSIDERIVKSEPM